jgi:hypothetical protein
MEDIVLFLGAGFSRAVGLPLMGDFAAASAESQPNLVKHANSPEGHEGFRHAGRRIRDSQRTFNLFRAKCLNGGILSEQDAGNLETIFCAAEAIHQAGERQIDLGGQVYSLDTILRDIQLWIWKTYQQIPTLTLKDHERTDQTEEPYRRLFATLRTAVENRITLLTTNYDIVTEYFAWEAGLAVQYPFEWDDSFRVGRGRKLFVQAASGPLLCKLHGSINYFEDRENPRPVPLVAADIGTRELIGGPGSQRYTNKPTVLAFDAIWHLQKKYGEGLTPAIIPPSYAKLREKPWLTDTWNAALRALSTATHLVFYSLPPSDGFMSALFLGASALRDPLRPLKVSVIDRGPETHARYARVFGDRVNPVPPLSFEDAIVDVLPTLLSGTVTSSPRAMPARAALPERSDSPEIGV